MKRIWRAVEVAAWTAFFGFAVLLLGLRFWVLPKVAEHREQIAAIAARTIGQPVKIGAIEAGWDGLRPQINLSDVRILDGEGREALVLPSIENVLSWSSLLHGDLRLSVLVFDAPRLTVRRDAAGAIYVAGLKLGANPGRPGFTDWLLGHDEIAIRNAEIEWIDEKRGAPPLALSALNLRLRNVGDEHAIGLVARPPASLGSQLELRAQLAGRTLTNPSAWSGKVYAELGATDLAAWRAWIDYPLDVREARGALRLWATLEAGSLTEATADVALAQVLAVLGPDLPALELTTLRGRLHARALRDGYELGARGLTLVPASGLPLQPTDFQVAWGGSAAEQHGTVSARLIEFEPLLGVAGALPLPADARELIAELGPTGRISDARFEWQGRFASPQRFTARARFSDFGLNSWGGAPGFAGLSGTLEASEKKGRLYLASRKAEIDLPQIFPDPRIAIDTLNGQVDWERHDDGALALRFTSVNFANADTGGAVYGSYTRPVSGPGTIDVVASLAHADAARVGRYLPHGRMLGGEKVRKWLLESIVAGQASDVRLRLKGDLREFPFVDPARGQFQVSAHVEHGVLRYGEDWPRIENIEGELQFDRDSMMIAGHGGTILGARLSNVRVGIPELSTPSPHLVISGQAAGPTREFLKFIQESPVRRTTGGMTEHVDAEGNGALRIKIDLPLADLPATRVAGDFNFSGNRVNLGPLPTIERASGGVSFTDAGFQVQRASGRLLNAPIEITGGTRANAVVELAAHVRNLKVADLPLDRPWRDYLAGSTNYAATLTVRDGHPRLRVESSLRGVTSNLPAPLAKAPADALPLRVEIAPSDAGQRDRVSVLLGRLAAMELLRRRQGEAMVVQRAGISLSPEPGQAVRLPERPGTLVYGSLNALDLDSWLALTQQGGDETVGGVTLDVRVGSLDIFGKRVTGLTVRAGTDAVGWSASVNAQELSGDISYRGGQVLARLDYLSIPPDLPGAKRARTLKPGDMPGVDLVAERFNFRGKPFGQLMLAANSGAQGTEWRLEKLALSSDDGTLRGSGVWRAAGDARPTSELEFQLDAADAGAFLARAGFPGVVKGSKATLLGSLAWRGEPSDIDYPTLAGDLKLEAAEGQFLEMDPGYGKLLSLMSLQQLPRRIGLDFSDVFSKGFKFSRIDAEARIDKGVMDLKEFRMSGSAADVEMRGDVDLAGETQNLRVRIIPGAGDAASTALVLVNPAVGAAALIAQRVLKNPLGQILAYQYSVTGSWADPKIARIIAPKVQPEGERATP